MSLIAILGRQPEIGVAELESLLGTDAVIRTLPPCYAELNADYHSSWANRLGGAIKVVEVITSLSTNEWRIIENNLIEYATQNEPFVSPGKLTIGISVYGLSISTRQLQSAGLTMKKQLRKSGRSIRLVPNTESTMNSAQVLHNKLTGDRGWDLCAIRDGQKIIIGRTVWSQDIESYTKRDQARPMRDTRVGMLPPKLAQVIVNLAAGKIEPSDDAIILDPFCGTGVMLQEAALMGYSVYGTDLEPRMVQYSIDNLAWLKNQFRVDFYARIELGDATTTQWSNTSKIAAVACETYLGAPMAGNVTMDYIEQERNNAQKLLKQAIATITSQIPSGTRCCFAVPAWFFERRTITLPLIDQITDMGYNLVSFRHTSRASMIYHREDQVVGRQLITCIKK